MRKAIAVPVRKLSVYLQQFRRSLFLECAELVLHFDALVRRFPWT